MPELTHAKIVGYALELSGCAINDPMIELRQVRFPKSKKWRIQKKWASDLSNYRWFVSHLERGSAVEETAHPKEMGSKSLQQ